MSQPQQGQLFAHLMDVVENIQLEEFARAAVGGELAVEVVRWTYDGSNASMELLDEFQSYFLRGLDAAARVGALVDRRGSSSPAAEVARDYLADMVRHLVGHGCGDLASLLVSIFVPGGLTTAGAAAPARAVSATTTTPAHSSPAASPVAPLPSLTSQPVVPPVTRALADPSGQKSSHFYCHVRGCARMFGKANDMYRHWRDAHNADANEETRLKTQFWQDMRPWGPFTKAQAAQARRDKKGWAARLEEEAEEEEEEEED